MRTSNKKQINKKITMLCTYKIIIIYTYLYLMSKLKYNINFFRENVLY